MSMTREHIIAYWKQQEARFKGMKFNANQKKVLDYAVNYHKSLLKYYTWKASKGTEKDYLFYLRNANDLYKPNTPLYPELRGDLFPEELTSYEMTYAWIMSVGDNDKLLCELFPNWYDAPRLIKVGREPRFNVNDAYNHNIISLEESYYMVLATLAYVITEGNGYDKVKKIYTEDYEAGEINKIKIDTHCYKIEVAYMDATKNYRYILCKPKKWKYFL